MSDMSLFVEKSDSTVIDALKKIDANRKGFLIIEDSDGIVVGTLTDGDIRRAFINGINCNSTITLVFMRQFKYLNSNDGLDDATELFKNSAIKFLPVLDENKKLVNIITKNQMHAILLQDIHADLSFDFSSINENIVDYEIYQRPWGFYKTTVMNDYFQSKIISVNPKSQLSLQSHNHRCFLQALFPQKCRLNSSKLHGEFPQYCISSAGTLSGAGEEPLQAYKVY